MGKRVQNSQRFKLEKGKSLLPAQTLIGFSGKLSVRKLKPIRRSKSDKIREKALEQDYFQKCSTLECRLKDHRHLVELMQQLVCCNGKDFCDSPLCQELNERHAASIRLIKFLLEQVGSSLEVLPKQTQAMLCQLLYIDKRLRVKLQSGFWLTKEQSKASSAIQGTDTSSGETEFFQIFVHGIKQDAPLVLMAKQDAPGQTLWNMVWGKCPHKISSSFILLHQGRKITDGKTLREQGLISDCNIHANFSLCGGMEKEKGSQSNNGEVHRSKGALNVGAKDVLVGDSCRDSLLKNISSDDEQLPLLFAIGSQKSTSGVQGSSGSVENIQSIETYFSTDELSKQRSDHGSVISVKGLCSSTPRNRGSAGISLSVDDRKELLHESSKIICNFWPPVDSCQFFMKVIKVNCDYDKNVYPKTYLKREGNFIAIVLQRAENISKLVNFVRTKMGQSALLRLSYRRLGILVKDSSKLNVENILFEMENESSKSKYFQIEMAKFEEVEASVRDLCVVHLHVRASPYPIHLTSPFLTYCPNDNGMVKEMEPDQLIEQFAKRDYQCDLDKLFDVVNGFEKQTTTYVLICSPFSLPTQERDLNGIVLPEWALVLDFDQSSNQEGHLFNIFEPLHGRYQVKRNLFFKTLDQEVDLDPRDGVCWCAVRGYEEINKTLCTRYHASWMFTYRRKMMILIEKLITHINRNQLVVVCLWDKDQRDLLPTLGYILQHIFSCWHRTKLAFVCSDSSTKCDVSSLLVEPLERAGFGVKRDNIFVALPHEMARHVEAKLPSPYRSADEFQIPRNVYHPHRSEGTTPDTCLKQFDKQSKATCTPEVVFRQNQTTRIKPQKAVARSAISVPQEDDTYSEISDKDEEESFLPLASEPFHSQEVRAEKDSAGVEGADANRWSKCLGSVKQGIIFQVHPSNRYGWIYHPNFSDLLLFHAKQIVPPVDSLSSIEIFTVVSFTVDETKKGLRAMKIKTVEEKNMVSQLAECREELQKEEK